jgi:hypothetical protein
VNALSYFSDNYVKDMLLASTVAALFVATIYYRRQPELRIFLYYTLFSFLTDLTDLYRVMVGVNERFPILLQAALNVVFTFFEFVVFAWFIYLQMSGTRSRRAIKILSSIYLTYMLLGVIWRHMFIWYQGFYFLESVFITILCLLYFYELFAHTPEGPLNTQPAFWIITGILLMNCCCIPLYLTIGFLGKYIFVSYNLIYLLYTVFFGLMIRAYLCKPRDQAVFSFV